MDNERLSEIRNNIARLPVLESRLQQLKQVILEAEGEQRQLLKRFNKETVDVEKLKGENFSVMLLRFVGKYEDKLDKESKEMLEAKWAYDQIVERLRALNKEKEDLQERILFLKKDKNEYEVELERRENNILRETKEEVSMQYRQYDETEKKLRKQMIEVDEAISVAMRAQETANRAISQLESARQWATYDAWTKGGMLSHMAKYDKIDEAQREVNRLSAELKNLSKELMDVEGMSLQYNMGIDNATRAVDFWFDNIFTDLRVRDKINEDQHQVGQIANRIGQVINELKLKRQGFQLEIRKLENQKEELLVNL